MAKRTPNPIPDDIAAQWHPTKNEGKFPSDYTAGSGFKPWWLCQKGHDFQAIIRDVNNGSWCVYCAGNKPWPGETDLATLRPEMAKQWHPTKNTLNPTEVTVASKSKVWWTGECGHDFIASVGARTVSGTGCPYCAGQKILVGFNDLATTHPEVALQWHPMLNGNVAPQETTAGVNKKFWWIGICGHEFNGSVAEKIRSGNNGCPYCAGQKILIGFNDLASQFPDIAAEWSSANKISADAISAKSTAKAKWVCQKGHAFEMVVRSRTSSEASCPYCAGQKILVGYSDLETTHPHLMNDWDYSKNENLIPSMFSKSNQDKVWWKCLNGMSHSYLMPITSRTSENPAGCNICSNRSLASGINDIATTHPMLAAQWHPTKNGTLLPSQVGRSFKDKVWWICAKGHESNNSPLARILSNGQGFANCLECQAKIFSSAGEKEIVHILETLGEEVIANRRKLLKGAELDIYLPKRNVAIEYNGLYWHSEGMNGKHKNYHYDKWLACKNVGVQLIQIWEDDWVFEKESVLESLLERLGITEKAEREMPELGIMSKPKVYARETTACKISLAEARDFFSRNHVEGFSAGTHYLGLRANNGKLVAALTLKKTVGETQNIVRYATDGKVFGGFAEILEYAETNIPAKRFIAFSDHCTSDGSIYVNSGFTMDKEFGPDYMYVVGKKRVPKSEYGIAKFKTDPKLKWEEGLSELQLSRLNNIRRIFDAGKTRWAKEIS